jgi:hypothetical protein
MKNRKGKDSFIPLSRNRYRCLATGKIVKKGSLKGYKRSLNNRLPGKERKNAKVKNIQQEGPKKKEDYHPIKDQGILRELRMEGIKLDKRDKRNWTFLAFASNKQAEQYS